MSDDHMKWCCRNAECKRINLMDKSIVEMAKEKNKRLLMVCGTCGYVYQFEEKDITRGDRWQASIPLRGMERHLPTGMISDGTFKDFEGKSWSINDFIEKHGVDPNLYLNWVKARKPKYSQTCD
jgi:hypothetical protein